MALITTKPTWLSWPQKWLPSTRSSLQRSEHLTVSPLSMMRENGLHGNSTPTRAQPCHRTSESQQACLGYGAPALLRLPLEGTRKYRPQVCLHCVIGFGITI